MKDFITIKVLQKVGAGMPTLASLWEWMKNQGQYALYMVIAYQAVKHAFNREYGKAVGMVFGVGGLVFIITNMDMVNGWISNIIKTLGGA